MSSCSASAQKPGTLRAGTLRAVDQEVMADYDTGVLPDAVEELHHDLDAAPNMTEADAMRAMSFTDESE